MILSILLPDCFEKCLHSFGLHAVNGTWLKFTSSVPTFITEKVGLSLIFFNAPDFRLLYFAGHRTILSLTAM